MEIIDAFWEKRNLGIETKEIILHADDSVSVIEHFFDSLSSEKLYLVVKVPVGRHDFIHFLTRKGFCFVESLFKMSIRLDTFRLPESFRRFDDKLKYKILTTVDDFKRLETEIKKGIFVTDRIAIDANFGIEVASNRYFNWIKDEIQKGSEVFEILYRETAIGFFTLKNVSNGKYNGFLAGMYRNDYSLGFGFSILSKPIIELKNRKAKIYFGHVSSNNLPIMRLLINFGYLPDEVFYVMTKINNNKNE